MSYFENFPRTHLRHYLFIQLLQEAVAQWIEQVVLKLSIKGQSKLTSYTFNVRVVGSNPICFTINGQLKLTSDHGYFRFESEHSFRIIINKKEGQN